MVHFIQTCWPPPVTTVPGSAKSNARDVARDYKLFLLFKLYILKKVKRILFKMRPNDINAMDDRPALIVPLCR